MTGGYISPPPAAAASFRLGEDAPRCATVAEIAARLEPHPVATMLLTAISEAAERYDPKREATFGTGAVGM